MPATASLTVDRLGPLREGINKTGCDSVENRPHYGFKRPARKRIPHGVDHLESSYGQLIELPRARRFGKRPIHQMEGNQARVLMVVSSGEGLLQPGDADRNGRFHSVFVVTVYHRAPAPGHEIRVARNVCHQIEHLLAAVGDQDGALYGMHRYGLMDRMECSDFTVCKNKRS